MFVFSQEVPETFGRNLCFCLSWCYFCFLNLLRADLRADPESFKSEGKSHGFFGDWKFGAFFERKLAKGRP